MSEIHVLVVDDSAVIRQTMVAIGRREGDLSVSVAADPLIAMERIRERRPDVILLDIEMPRMDGLTFLRQLMSGDPIPVVVCSALAARGTDIAFRALEEGAVDVVAKPALGVSEFLSTSSLMLVDTIRAAAEASPRLRKRASVRAPLKTSPLELTSRKVIAVGASTGGVEALREVLETLPPDVPGLVIVQHMPEVFTARFARRLDSCCRIAVKEAATGDRVIDGRALIAPGNRHTVVVRDGAEYRVEVLNGPLHMRHRPSVDVLFCSVADAAGANAIGVIMTGMGADGASGLLEMKRAGAMTVAQDEESCAVFGMPREAIALGAVDHVAPPVRIAELLAGRVSSGVASRRGWPE